MLDAVPLLPHLERLLRRIENVEAPLIQVWGWPGSGRTALLSSFLDRQGPQAVGLSLADLSSDEAVERAVEGAARVGARWLVANGGPAAGLTEAAHFLLPAQRLVFASSQRWTGAVPPAVLPPQELLLDAEEVAALWYVLTGIPLDQPGAEALWRLSDGWYRPLRLALEATGGFGLDQLDPGQLLEIPPVRFFLRHEVLDTFSETEWDALLAAPDERVPGDPGWAVLDARGLWVEGPDSDCMPRLLSAACERERRRRWRQQGRPGKPGTGVSAAGTAGSGREETRGPQDAGDGERTTYRLGLLGAPLAVERGPDGERNLETRLRRAFLVLAYLASSPGMEAGREELIEAIWPMEGEHTIERNFHPTLSHLRRALEGSRRDRRLTPLLFRAGVYRLNPEIAWEIDVLDFARLIEEGKALADRGDLGTAAEALGAAWKLYRGPFLLGHYDAWAAARREGYQRQYLDLLRDLGGLYLRLERTEEAMDAFRSVLLEDPLQEKIHVEVMRLYAAQGRRDLVRRQYDRLCSMLLDELGVEPLTDTTKEYHRLVARA
jgi:DNA-binding SARP family transcriptional activator